MTNKNEITTIPANDVYSAVFNVQQQASTSIKANAVNPVYSKDGKKTYADLYNIMESITPLLGVNGLLLMQSISNDCIETTIHHVSSSTSIIKHHIINMSNLNAQQMGSYITYMRRYTICALLGIVADKDDDGNSAVGIDDNRKLAVKKADDKPVLTAKEFESLPFTKALDKYLNDDFTPQQILDKMTAKYTLTADQEATILNLK